jgi:hypothetical protein
VRFVPPAERGPALGSSCLGGLLAAGLAAGLVWLDAWLVVRAFHRRDEDAYVVLVTAGPAVLAYLVILVLGDDLAVRVARPGLDLWVVRTALLGGVLALGAFGFFLVNDRL